MEYARWMSPIGMRLRRISHDCIVLGYNFKKNDTVFFMFGAANRDPAVFATPEVYDIDRDTGPAIPFGPCHTIWVWTAFLCRGGSYPGIDNRDSFATTL